ncbi:hypothetical protein BX600DRAFT_516160 [Xylariales sp. PMI_506]|nr:hypothetical protein BX600DRAFT_516160 [Xylariales sp. PMI_506]
MASAAKKFNVGVVGYGLSAKVFQIPFIKTTPSLQLYSILQRSPKPDDSAPADYPNLQHHTMYDEFLADPALDVVVLSTIPSVHFEQASKALKAGKHILVEKPFVPTSAEAEQLITLAREHKRLICVFQNRRWDSDFLTVRKLVEEGTLGRVYEFETHFDRYRADRPTNWKGLTPMNQGGGFLYDLGSHLSDQVFSLFGKPRSVFAKFINQRDGTFFGPGGTAAEDETDGAIVQLFYPNGLVALVRMGVMSVEKEQPRFWVRGTKGTFRKNFLDPQEDQLRGGMTTDDAAFGHEDPARSGTLTTITADGKFEEKKYPTIEPVTYKAFYRQFAAALASGKEEDVPVPATQARDVLRIIEAARESSRTGKEVLLQ